MTPGAGSACFHCGEPIPAGVRIHARIESREEPVCCHGCKAVAEFITIIGIPFALKDLELAKLALAPIGRTIRDKP